MLRQAALLALFAAFFHCGSEPMTRDPVDEDGSERPDFSGDFGRDILDYGLIVDLEEMSGIATLTIAGAPSTGLSLEKGNMSIVSVSDSFGPLEFLDLGRELQIGVPKGGDTRTLDIEYEFTPQLNFDGWLAEPKLTFLWPSFCGSFFPCHSDPGDGATFSLEVSGTDQLAIYPKEIGSEAPTYMPAIAIGDFEEVSLGTTESGTEVVYWHLPGRGEAAAAGTKNLLAAFAFLEETYGPYSFGNKVGSVEANWGPGAVGGMEHHPFWHVASDAMSDEETHAHEAAHGWFGNGVRIECWEDFVLSEGVVTYMAARALEEAGVDLWPSYDCSLKRICGGVENTTALLTTCNEIDLINHELWSSTPYQKGAQYLREVALLLGVEVVDQALAEFYQEHVGKAARMRELVDLLKSKGESEAVEELTAIWLEGESCPARINELCSTVSASASADN